LQLVKPLLTHQLEVDHGADVMAESARQLLDKLRD
jgi:hypothetical protein